MNRTKAPTVISVNGDLEEILEAPTDAAFVTITTTRNGPTFKACVPANESGRLLDTVGFACAVVGTVISPFGMAKALESIGSGLPWQTRIACIITAALLPLACYWLASSKK